MSCTALFSDKGRLSLKMKLHSLTYNSSLHTCTHASHTHTHTHTLSPGLPTAEQNTQAKQLEERMKSLEGRRQQLEQQQVTIIQQLRALQTMEKQFQEAVKIQGQSGATTGVVIKLVLRKRYDYSNTVIASQV